VDDNDERYNPWGTLQVAGVSVVNGDDDENADDEVEEQTLCTWNS
jgi:hypothetical protein